MSFVHFTSLWSSGDTHSIFVNNLAANLEILEKKSNLKIMTKYSL